MTRGQTRILAIALVALTAVLVGFQGASTLLTVTQLGASPPNPSAKQPKLPAQPPQTTTALVQPNEPAPVPMPAPRAGEPAQDEPPPAVSVAASDAAMPIVTDNSTGIAAAAKAKAQAEMDAMGPQLDQDAPSEPRRYRAPRPELHKVY